MLLDFTTHGSEVKSKRERELGNARKPPWLKSLPTCFGEYSLYRPFGGEVGACTSSPWGGRIFASRGLRLHAAIVENTRNNGLQEGRLKKRHSSGVVCGCIPRACLEGWDLRSRPPLPGRKQLTEAIVKAARLNQSRTCPWAEAATEGLQAT